MVSSEKFNSLHKCCYNFEYYLNHKVILCDEKFRTYSIVVNNDALQELFYCPWCSMKLPESLREEYYDIVERNYGYVGFREIEENREKIPEEFFSDQWWKNRGL